MLIERLIGAGSVCVLVAGIAALSDEVNLAVWGVIKGEPLVELSLGGWRLARIASMVTETLSSYAGDHTSLVLYGLGALVLVGLMLRT